MEVVEFGSGSAPAGTRPAPPLFMRPEPGVVAWSRNICGVSAFSRLPICTPTPSRRSYLMQIAHGRSALGTDFSRS
jgi:hypothetical protein